MSECDEEEREVKLTAKDRVANMYDGCFELDDGDDFEVDEDDYFDDDFS